MLYCTYNLLNMFRAQSHNFPHPGRIACCSAPNNRPPATKTLHTICGNNTSIVSSSWWWAYECPKHVQQQSHNFPHPGHIACCSAPNSRPPATKALHTVCGNNTSIVSSSWWWAYKCPKHVEQIISAIMHSVTSSWVSSLRLNHWLFANFKTVKHKIRINCF
jgi:hypothetical protein